MTPIHGLIRRLLLTITGCAVTSLSHGAQPPDVVVSDSAQNTAMGTAVLLHVTAGNGLGEWNTGAGWSALSNNTTGNGNSAFGLDALFHNTTGTYNTAIGNEALVNNTTANWNTAAGAFALTSNTSGDSNSAFGVDALIFNTTGNQNSAFGYEALDHNTTGYNNTAVGYAALQGGTGSPNVGTGYWNTAAGVYTLTNNINGVYNSAFGGQALNGNKDGIENTALGTNALYSNTSGNGNTAAGMSALVSNTSGSNNIAVGQNAGSNVTTGSNNIHIGAVGAFGDSGDIRIGTQGTQTATYIAGINSSHVTGAAVYVTSSGQLGVQASSERYKTTVARMGSTTGRLKHLRPVTFQLKTDPKAGRQYGLIAEEVAKVYPELVIRNEAGQAEGVRYEELTPMLLNEVQQQQRTIADQGKLLRDMQQQLAELQEFRRTMQERTGNR